MNELTIGLISLLNTFGSTAIKRVAEDGATDLYDSFKIFMSKYFSESEKSQLDQQIKSDKNIESKHISKIEKQLETNIIMAQELQSLIEKAYLSGESEKFSKTQQIAKNIYNFHKTETVNIGTKDV